jgi:hypothetical protein
MSRDNRVFNTPGKDQWRKPLANPMGLGKKPESLNLTDFSKPKPVIEAKIPPEERHRLLRIKKRLVC